MVACLDAKGCYMELSGGWGWWDAKVGATHAGHGRTPRGALSEAFAAANYNGTLDDTPNAELSGGAKPRSLD